MASFREDFERSAEYSLIKSDYTELILGLIYADDYDGMIKELEKSDLSELADSEVSVYTSDLLKWYAEDFHRMYYADEAISEGGLGLSFSDILGRGQYIYYMEIYEEEKSKLIDALEGFEGV